MKKTTSKKPQKMVRTIYPPSIVKGDTIGLVAPAGSIINKDNFTAGVQILKDRGFQVKFNRKLLNTRGYLAGSDRERADDFNRLWSDSEVKALVAARGGYGSLRMVDLIDMRQIRKNPKILFGFSDLTVLLNAIHTKTGLVTFHGPVVTTLAGIDKQSKTSFFDVMAGKNRVPRTILKGKFLRNGQAKGILYGGNLTTLVHMIDTPYEIQWSNSILFIEDTGEAPYKLDRLLTHLYKAERLQKIKGLILGTFTDEHGKENPKMTKTVHERIADFFKDSDIPILANFPAGHSSRNLTLPVGVEVKMDSGTGQLSFTDNK